VNAAQARQVARQAIADARTRHQARSWPGSETAPLAGASPRPARTPGPVCDTCGVELDPDRTCYVCADGRVQHGPPEGPPDPAPPAGPTQGAPWRPTTIGEYANPYLICDKCRQRTTGGALACGGFVNLPCGHHGDFHSVCPSWSPVDGCNCARAFGVVEHGFPTLPLTTDTAKAHATVEVGQS